MSSTLIRTIERNSITGMWLCVAVGCFGCAPLLQTVMNPGGAMLDITNGTTVKVCLVSVYLPNEKVTDKDNYCMLEPGERCDVRLKPAAYHIKASTCHKEVIFEKDVTLEPRGTSVTIH
jgi:hypothetical protein